MKMKTTPQYDKLRIALNWRLLGAGLHDAKAAFEYVENLMDGKYRKDGVTPAFQHQINQALHAFTLKDVEDFEGLIITILGHDVMEDYDISHAQIVQRFGSKNHISIWAMTKTYQGIDKVPEQVFRDIANDPNASLAKGLDRIDNFQSMVGVFNREKQLLYIQEGIDYFLPMLKAARKKFSRQTDAYLNIEKFIKSQIQLLQVINREP